MQNQFNYKLVFQLLSVLFLLSFNACKKNVVGPKGDTGAPGKNGNSTLKYSAIVTQPSAAWDTISNDNIKVWESNLTVPEITLNVLKNGTVKVYLSVDGHWWPLPYTEDEVVTQFTFKQNTVILNVSNLHEETPDRPEAQQYRVVVTEQKI